MSEFVGRTGGRRVYSYPERPRGSDLQLLARNFASGPKVDTEIEAEPVELPWNTIDAGVADWDIATAYVTGDLVFFTGIEYVALQDGTGHQPDTSPLFWEASAAVPITPRSTGIIVIEAMVVLVNGNEGNTDVVITAFVDGTPVSPPEDVTATVLQDGSLVVPYLAQVEGLAIGTTAHITLLIEGEGLTLEGDSSTIEVREVIASTG